MHLFFDNCKNISIRGLSIPSLTEGDFRPLNPRKVKKRLASDNVELIVIYGRRRIGKTFLVLNALEGDFIYYLGTEKNNLRKFKEIAEGKFHDLKYAKEDWESVFHYLRDSVVAIDEFPYMIKEDPSVLFIFQKIVDETLKGSKTKIILLGSSISVMEDVLSCELPGPYGWGFLIHGSTLPRR
ncbi:hypothetical protein IC007_0856 [Sulfuracidifex tepidarius]|uniref:ATPase domain-containing protein n=1 Tax=Sulfuracidifex tepidarius TaxID=1294262 RepID=A0A510E2R4_9CREN|nr:hypothetical protein IC007_0856 [Sulfuracidifex tepidarius]